MGLAALGQENAPAPQIASMDPRVTELGLPAATAETLQAAMRAKDLRSAEQILLRALEAHNQPARTARLLTYLGGVYFAAGDPFQAAVAWKKADALAPLQPPVRFSLAMAYVRLGHGDWAQAELKTLARQQSTNPLYAYWLGRTDYDAHRYQSAIAYFQDAIGLDAGMARAHDNLGLCYFYLNQNVAAEKEFRTAIALDERNPTPSPWPHLNLAIELEFTNRLDAAIAELRRALALQPSFPEAQFELGNALEHQGHIGEAKAAFTEAARLNPNYPEPHFALARLLRREGDSAGAAREVDVYKRLHAGKEQGAPTQAGAP